jgi:hypothetical protein
LETFHNEEYKLIKSNEKETKTAQIDRSKQTKLPFAPEKKYSADNPNSLNQEKSEEERAMDSYLEWAKAEMKDDINPIKFWV